MLSSNASCCHCRCSCGNSQGIQHQLNFPCIKKTSISRAKSKTAPKSYTVAIQNLCNRSDAPFIMSSNSHSQALHETLVNAKFQLGEEESRLRLMAKRIKSRSFTLSPDYKTFMAEIQSCSAETQLQHINSRIKYVKEMQTEALHLNIQNSKDSKDPKDPKDSKDSRKKSRRGEPAPKHKNYNVFPETHPSVFGKPLCDISRALSSI